jgi:ABC-type bacteriocin/lantibiotic exporter with double-glycine peptidase domain
MFKNLLTLFNSNDYKKFAMLAIGFLGLSIVEVGGIASIIPFMSIIIDPNNIHSITYLSELYNYFSFDDESIFIIYFGYAVIFVLIVSNSYGAFMAWVTHHFTNFLTYRLSTRLLKKYITQNYAFFFNRNTSELSKNIFTEVDRIIGGVLIPLISIFSKVITSLLILSALIYVDSVVAIVSILILGGCYLIIFKLIHVKLSTLGIRTSELTGLRYKIASESMLGIKAVILHNIEWKFIKEFESTSLEYFRNIAESSVISALPRYALETISFSGIILIALFVSNLIFDSEKFTPFMLSILLFL